MDIDDSSSLSSLSEPEDDAPAPAADASPENGAGSRRRSTRVVKKVQVYSEPLSTRKPKRKRAADSDVEADGNAEKAPEQGSASPGTIQGDDDNDDNNEDDDGEESEEEFDESASEDEPEESEGEPDEEELKERRMKNRGAGRGRGAARGRGGRAAAGAIRKPATKKVKTATGEAADASPAPESRKKKAPAKSRTKGKAKAKPNGDVPAPAPMINGLYDAVFEGEESQDDVAAGWIAKYQADNSEGMKEMINFVLKCCGCDNEVTSYDIEDQDSASTTLSEIQDAFQQQQTADYPLTSKKPVFRKFRQSLSSFIESLISTCISQDLVISDPGLLENMQVWITAMSSSTLRQFRHTSTVFALDMVTHLSQNAAEIRRANGTTNRQLEAEQKKSAQNEARINNLTTKVQEGEQKLEAVENIIKDIFDTVFVHRYRDVDAKIRVDCIHELSNWVQILPDLFFDGAYIRYMGWILSDTVANTRLEVVKALTKMFKRKDSVAGLRHFSERFRERMVEMGARDADTTVRAATIELLDVIREVGYLEPEDIETTGRLLFDSEQKVRRAVVPFFVENINDLYNEKLEDLGGEEAVQEALGDEDDEDYEGPTLSWIKLKCLVESLSAYDQVEVEDEEGRSQNLLSEKTSFVMKVEEIVSRFSLAGAVLWDALDEVRDWEGLARYLLYDHSASLAVGEDVADEEDVEKKVKRTVALDAKEDVILLQILHASLMGTIYKGPDPPNKKKPHQPRNPKEIEKHKENVSRSLMTFIPLLLKKFGPVPEAACTVLRLEHLMNLDVFQELRQSAAYSSLLDDINRQFLTHSDEGVLREACAALMHAKTFEDLHEVTELKLGQLKDEVVSALGNTVRGKDPSTAKFSDASLTELINTVRRLEHLCGITDCIESLESPLAAATANESTEILPVEVLIELLTRGTTNDELIEELTLRVLRTLTFYFMWKVRSCNTAGDALEDAELDTLIGRHGKVVERITTILNTRLDVDAVKIAAATALLDLTTLFVSASVPRLASLNVTLDADIRAQLMAVFDSVEKSFAKGTGKQLEPAEDAPPEDEEEEEDVEPADEATQLMLEQRLCEFASKIVIACLAKVLDIKEWRKRLGRNQSRLGPNFKEVVNHLDRATVGRPGVRRGPQKKIVAPAKAPQKSAERVVEDDEEEDVEEDAHHEEEEEEEEPHHDEEENEEQHEEEHHDSEPDPEAEVPEDQDEDMLDV